MVVFWVFESVEIEHAEQWQQEIFAG